MQQTETTKSKSNSRSDFFLTEDFLLQSKAAKNLFHHYAASLPIIDYHNHLPVQAIADNKKYDTITELWLNGDHYKWRGMRTLGVSENLITGNATDREKFYAWAACVPKTVRNPLFHWTQMELKNPFGITDYLNKDSAPVIYDLCNDLLKKDRLSTKSLLQHFNVEMVCSTDDPCDDLAAHKALATDSFAIKALPGFRPDKVFAIHDKEKFIAYIKALEQVSDINITDLTSLLQALQKRVDYFHENNCRIADHGLANMPSLVGIDKELENELKTFLQSKGSVSFSEPEKFTALLLRELCKMYHAKGWVQQFHLGALRNNNSRMQAQLGVDSGFDSIGDFSQAQNLSTFLNELDKTNQLAKTIIYNNNPTHNEVFAAMIGNFNNSTIKGKVQYGSGWWFADQLDGMEKQINALSSIGIISTFVGMLTDSRSFLSFSRHEYFRRILCNIFGNEMEKGLLPNDEEWIGNIIKDICYFNAREYFNL